jgi:hypothetical protein
LVYKSDLSQSGTLLGNKLVSLIDFSRCWRISSFAYNLQVRPSPAAISSGTPDKTQASRCEQWTKDVIEYLQYLLDELLSRNSSFPAQQTRDRSPQMLYTGSMQKNSPASTSLYGEETSLHFKWWYMVRLLQWHHAEGLLFPNLIVDWVLKLLQVCC